MTGQRQHYVVAYDVTSNKRRRRVRAVLNEWRVAAQKSVHICWITPGTLEPLSVEVCAEIDAETDKLLIAKIKGVIFQTEATDAVSNLVVVK